MDSGSTDDSYMLINDWISTNECSAITFHNLQKETNMPSSSTNVGIIHARGDIIAFMDCGLQFNEDWLATQYEYMESHGLDVVSGVCYLEGEGAVDRAAVAQTYGYKRMRPCIPSSLMRRSVFERIGLFYENIRAFYDVDLINRLLMNGIVRGVNPDVVVRYHGTNYADTLTRLFRKVIVYSEPGVRIQGYSHPKVYIAIGLLFLSLLILQPQMALYFFVAYLLIRGFIIPAFKSRNFGLVQDSPLSSFLLPVVGITIDAGKVTGYLKGYIKFLGASCEARRKLT